MGPARSLSRDTSPEAVRVPLGWGVDPPIGILQPMGPPSTLGTTWRWLTTSALEDPRCRRTSVAHDGGKILIYPCSVLHLAQLANGVSPLGDLLELHYPFSLLSGGPRGAPEASLGCSGADFLRCFLRPTPSSVLGCFSVVDAPTCTVAGALAADGTVDPLPADSTAYLLPAPPLDFIFPRLNIYAR
ncbi:hypothetical protein B296_00033712 [Ensete ventricosum]|uniref:Uncharacterized protein n=1 Tax=Ensete ventricosum TaxID=4639 RepID=A0A427A945_ENSVE|nr:hypothetical protein B296_00033712 [Ensete ventricosum]